ncbi:DBIRD complex subunit ZNF326-like isoform X6 [Thunnus albacares]|uniref:DBIRD complex subunit ZNF326-like isoform X6 n=1 Tax=Thunnus albacares TaxID=8236 RepID=UPI001CF681AA|nr:DBIRD complex subunit ZNF326-like isoform X6 [Thunnus albacares]
MNRQSNVPFNTSAAAIGAAPVGLFNQQQTGSRTPQDYREGMIHIPVKTANSNIRTSDMAAKKLSAQRGAAQSSAGKWKSSFKPIGDELSQDGNSQDKSTNCLERTELYDPYDPVSSDSDPYDPVSSDSEISSDSDMPRRGPNHNHSLPDQDNNLSRQCVSPGLEQITPSKEVTKNRSRTMIMDNPITCDLCEVEFANGQELEDHLDSRSHWDTLEHIQQQNNYDDLAIAFLQEVMLYKSRQCSRAIEDSALQALQENDHMTKVEMFHCASCQVFISTSASSVQSHITSQEHLSNTKEFEVRQRRACLDKAETMMTELKPQFEHFLKVGSPFV